MYSCFPYASFNRAHPYQYQSSDPSPTPDSSDSAYFRALADEQAARQQYLAARRAQEEARQRAARAHLARQAHSPYSSYLPHDGEDDFDDGMYGFGPTVPSRQQRAMMEEQRRREMLERERTRLEEERRMRHEEERRERIIEEERRRRAAEEERRQRLMEEERLRHILEEEDSHREEQDWQRRRQPNEDELDPLLRALGLSPAGFGRDEDMSSRPGRAPTRIHTASPPQRRRPMRSQEPRKPTTAHPQPHPASSGRSFSLPPHASTTKPTSPSPKPQHEPSLNPEQTVAARKILAAYRTHASRAHALRAIASLHTRFASLKAGFAGPPTIDFLLPSGAHVTVPVESVIPSPSVDAREVSEEDGRPRLAYTSTNGAIHSYQEELNRILASLDTVESGGDIGVRESRRDLARSVEQEAERVERWIGEVWDEWVRTEGRRVVSHLPEDDKAQVQLQPREADTTPEIRTPINAESTTIEKEEPQTLQTLQEPPRITISVVGPALGEVSPPEAPQLHDDLERQVRNDAGESTVDTHMQVDDPAETFYTPVDVQASESIISQPEVEARATTRKSEANASEGVLETPILASVETKVRATADAASLSPLDIHISDIQTPTTSTTPAATIASDIAVETNTAEESSSAHAELQYSSSEIDSPDVPHLDSGVETDTASSPRTPSLTVPSSLGESSPTIVPVELPAVDPEQVPIPDDTLSGIEKPAAPRQKWGEVEIFDLF